MPPEPIELGDDIFDTVDWNDILGLWLQPLATVTTGLLAVLAATIAYRAVKRQIMATAENVQKEIAANAAGVSAQIAADRSERRRAERIDVAADGPHWPLSWHRSHSPTSTTAVRPAPRRDRMRSNWRKKSSTG